MRWPNRVDTGERGASGTSGLSDWGEVSMTGGAKRHGQALDRIAIGPSRVFVIDAKKYTGKIEVRDVGSLLRADLRLYVKGRDRTKLVDGMLRQMEVVRTALGEEFADVEINGVLCFVGCEWGWIKRTKRVKGVTSLWPAALPDHVSSAGALNERIKHIAEHLRVSLRPAT